VEEVEILGLAVGLFLFVVGEEVGLLVLEAERFEQEAEEVAEIFQRDAVAGQVGESRWDGEVAGFRLVELLPLVALAALAALAEQIPQMEQVAEIPLLAELVECTPSGVAQFPQVVHIVDTSRSGEVVSFVELVGPFVVEVASLEKASADNTVAVDTADSLVACTSVIAAAVVEDILLESSLLHDAVGYNLFTG